MTFFYPRQNNKHQTFRKHPLQKLSARTHYSNIWCSLEWMCMSIRHFLALLLSASSNKMTTKAVLSNWSIRRYLHVGLCHSMLHCYIWSCLMWNSEQFFYHLPFLQREMNYWHMTGESIHFSRPLMTTLFQLWQCPSLTWLCQVHAVFSL